MKKAEIIELFKQWEISHCVPSSVYEPIAIEIAKLFEAEGEVKYIIQHRYQNRGCWAGIHSDSDKTEIIETFQYLYKNIKDSLFTYRIVKRTTTDQIIEE